MNNNDPTQQGDTLFRCPSCQAEETYLFRDVLLNGWPVCKTCKNHQHMDIVNTRANLPTAFDQVVQPIVERAGEAWRALNREL